MKRRRVVFHLNEDTYFALQRYADAIGHPEPESLEHVVAAIVHHLLADRELIRICVEDGWVAVEGPMPECYFVESAKRRLDPEPPTDVEDAERVFWRELNRGQK